ncbi:hypothetical protein LXL04_030656 [Taraxacum kok-saghyz]
MKGEKNRWDPNGENLHPPPMCNARSALHRGISTEDTAYTRDGSCAELVGVRVRFEPPTSHRGGGSSNRSTTRSLLTLLPIGALSQKEEDFECHRLRVYLVCLAGSKRLSVQQNEDLPLQVSGPHHHETSETRRLLSELLEDVADKTVHDPHGFTGDTDVRMNLLQNLEEVDLVSLDALLALLLLNASTRHPFLGSFFSAFNGFFSADDGFLSPFVGAIWRNREICEIERVN